MGRKIDFSKGIYPKIFIVLNDGKFKTNPMIEKEFKNKKFDYSKWGIYKALISLQKYGLVTYNNFKWRHDKNKIENYFIIKKLELEKNLNKNKLEIKNLKQILKNLN